MSPKVRDLLITATSIPLGLGFSYLLALAGEPRSVWVMQILGIM